MNMKMSKRVQRRIVGGREALPSCVEKRIWQRIDREARVYNTSRSFVIAVALADAFGIPLEVADRYNTAYRAPSKMAVPLRRVK
jgi:hypothetical protein